MRETELVLVPTPGMGHLLSAVELGNRIVQRNDRVSVVVLIFNFPMDSTVVNAYVESKSRDSNPSLTFVTLPPLSEPPQPNSHNFFSTFLSLQKPLVKQAVQDRVNSGSPKPAGFILDMFCTTIIDVANELDVPSYIFFPSGANLLNLMFYFDSLAQNNGVDIATEYSDPNKEVDAPGFVNRVPGKVIPSVFLDKETGGSEMIMGLARGFRECKGILINTFKELESYGLDSLLDMSQQNEIPPVYPVGPILELDSESRGGTKKEERESILEWLDEQPDSSVVFLCFGSMGVFGEEQVKEIANGLDRSGNRFLRSLRRPAPEGKLEMANKDEIFYDALPEGFLDRTAQRGKIIAWAPQVSILAHPSVGGFVSHCGWNSTLESLWFGVPIATWPMYAEQQLNAFELVKELGLAVEIRMDHKRDWMTKKQNFVVTAEEIENGVIKLMSMDEEKRQKVKEISDKARKALEDGGSSHHSLGRFIGDVVDNVCF